MYLLIEAFKEWVGGCVWRGVRARERVGEEEEEVEGLWSVELDRLAGVRACLCGLKTGFLGGGGVSVRGGVGCGADW